MTWTEPTSAQDSHQRLLHYHQAVYSFIREKVLAEIIWSDFDGLLTIWQKAAEQGSGLYANLLPVLTAIVLGGDPEKAIPAAASWSLYYLGARMFDDLQDQDKIDMPWSTWPISKTVPLALGVLFAAQKCLLFIEVDSHSLFDIHRRWSTTGFLAARAQMAERIPDIQAYFQRIIANTGLLFASACWFGARVATENLAELQVVYDFGIELGTTIQVANDLSGLVRDIERGRLTLATLYAKACTEHSLRHRLLALLEAPARDNVTEIMAILETMGALSYCVQVARIHQQKALGYLQHLAQKGADVHDLETYTHRILSRYHETHGD